MTTDNHDDAAAIEAFARALDALPNRPDVQGPATDPVVDVLIATASALAQLDQAEPPSTSFVDRLEASLMHAASSPATRSLTTSPARSQPFLPVTHPPSSARPASRRRWRGAVEFAALAAMLLAIVSSTLYTSGFGLLVNGPASRESGVGMERGNAARTGVYDAPGPGDAPVLVWRSDAWKVDAGEASLQFLPPIVVENDIYLLNWAKGQVHHIDLLTERWTLSGSLGLVLGTNLAVANGTVFVATSGSVNGGGDAGYLIALDAQTLVERWRVETGGVINASLAVAEGLVYVLAADGTLSAHATDDGETAWKVRLDLGGTPEFPWHLRGHFAPAISSGTVYVTSGSPTMYAVDASSGVVQWRFDALDGRLGTAAIIGDSVYVVARDGGEGGRIGAGAVYRVDAATGASVWSAPIAPWDAEIVRSTRGPSFPESLTPAVDGERVYVIDTDPDAGNVLALRAVDGSEAWNAPMPSVGGAAPVVADGRVLLSRQDGGIYALDAVDGSRRWRLDTGRRFLTSPVAAVDRLAVVSQDGALFVLGPASALAGTPSSSAAGATTPSATGDDIWGLPPCESPRLQPDPLPTGAPVATLNVPTTNGAARPENLPRGEPAPAEVLSGILTTLRALPACVRPGFERQLGGFFSDDYYRRAQQQMGNGMVGNGPLVPDALVSGVETGSFNPPILLEDGRVGVLLLGDDDAAGEFLVFVEHDGAWLIDERVHVDRNPSASKG